MLLPAVAAAADCFDYAAWRQAVVEGDLARAGALVTGAKAACQCASDDTGCLPVLGSSRVVSVNWLNDAAQRLTAWRKVLVDACQKLPESTPEQQQAKRTCYQEHAQTFADGLAGEVNGQALAAIPPLIAQGLGANLGQTTNPTLPGDKPPPKEYSDEVKGIGRQICSLTERLEDDKDKLDRVRRRGSEAGAAKAQRMAELEDEIRTVSEMLLTLKRKFRSLTGEDFNAFDFCEAPKKQ
jgi:hypothetical protein